MSLQPLVSIITVVRNGEATLQNTINSVLAQDYPRIEYLVVDGASTDGTLAIVERHATGISRWISEPDRGLYDALNKGIGMATGDIIGLLHADDVYQHAGVISQVVNHFAQSRADAVFADLIFVSRQDSGRVLRHYSASRFCPEHMLHGAMPPHPTLFVRAQLHRQYGLYDPGFKIAGDFEWMLRLFYLEKVAYSYLPAVLVRMRTGGLSDAGPASRWHINRETLQALRKHRLPASPLRLLKKYPAKLRQLVAALCYRGG